MGVASYLRRGDPGLVTGGCVGERRLGAPFFLPPTYQWGSCVSVVMRSVFGSLYVIWALLLGFVCIVLGS